MSPVQTPASKVEFYRIGDTAPDLERQLVDGNGVPYNLNGAHVFLTLAPVVWQYYGSFAYPSRDTLLHRSPCNILDQTAFGGWVSWTPGTDELRQAGTYGLYFEIEWPDGRWQSISSKNFKPLVVNPKPGYTPAPPGFPAISPAHDTLHEGLRNDIDLDHAEIRLIEDRLNALRVAAGVIGIVPDRANLPAAPDLTEAFYVRDERRALIVVDDGKMIGTSGAVIWKPMDPSAEEFLLYSTTRSYLPGEIVSVQDNTDGFTLYMASETMAPTDPAPGTAGATWFPLATSNTFEALRFYETDALFAAAQADPGWVNPPNGTRVFTHQHVWEVDSLGVWSQVLEFPSTAAVELAIATNTGTIIQLTDAVGTLVTGIKHEAAVQSISNGSPLSPVPDELYIVGATPTNAFVGHANEIASFISGAWTFATPQTNEAHLVEDQAAIYSWNGTAWVKIQVATSSKVFRSGVGSQTPATNPPTKPNEGDLFVNFPDRRAWVYVEDWGGASGTYIWTQLFGAAVTTTNVAATGPPAAPPATPTVGDRFVNTTLGVEWVFADDPANPGTDVWLRVGQCIYDTPTPPNFGIAGGPSKANNWGFAAGTVPDPQVVEPNDGDLIRVQSSGHLIIL